MNYMNTWSDSAKSQIFFYMENVIKKYEKAIQQWLLINIPKMLSDIDQCWINKFSVPDMDNVHIVTTTMIEPAVDVMILLNMEEIMLQEDLPTVIIIVDEMNLIEETINTYFNEEKYYE